GVPTRAAARDGLLRRTDAPHREKRSHTPGAALSREPITFPGRAAGGVFPPLAAQSAHFASFGRDYQLPPQQEETSLADLVDQLGGLPTSEPSVYFDAEGGWQKPPSEN